MQLPSGLHVHGDLGEGRRSRVYLAEYLGESVVLKVYRPEFVAKYRARHRVHIGEFEFQRNRLLYESETLRRYIARPILLLQGDGDHEQALIQEYVPGTRLLDLIRQARGLPATVLDAGHFIVREAGRLSIYDLDISPGNILVLEDEQGWYPKLHDFNLLPQHLFPANPFMALGFHLGLRNKNHRDYRCLAQWQQLGRRAKNQGAP